MYNEFANLYDELMNDVNYENWFLYIKKNFKRFKKDPKKILEMACGTGNISYYFAKNGYDLTCFDLSVEMLSVAENKLRRFNNVQLLKQNMIDFSINEKYDAIISVCDGINYILNPDELLTSFKNVNDHLNNDGLFVFDISSYYKLKNIIGYNTFVEDREDIHYTWQNYFDENKNIAELYLTFFIKTEDGKYIRFDEEHFQKAYKINQIVDLLEKALFKNIYYFDGITFNEPNSESERISFVAFN